jgi:probable rRNA maturation factor
VNAVEIDIQVEDGRWTEALADAGDLAEIAAQRAMEAAGRGDGAVAVLLADDAAVQDLNARFRGQDKPTNVLSFPAPADAPFAGVKPLGDVILAFGVCAAEAAEQGKPLAHHLQHLVAHGVLHLLGYDHLTDGEATVMETLERRILAGLGAPDPYLDQGSADAGHG